MTLLIGIILSYLIGSIPTGYVIGKVVKNADIRQCGSGNVGATNVFRSVGKRWGILVLLIDALKGLIAVICISLLCKSELIDMRYLQGLYGIAAVCGHSWTIFLKFKGGKGVATTCGVILALFPKALGLSLLVFILVFALTRYVSLGSMLAALLFPVHLWFFYRHQEGFFTFLLFSFLMIAFIIYRHRSNITRLFNGNENKIVFRK
ncbi:MAG: glycerol-3-phosphate 1-O-acyltransferase PlsY [Candidatus Omnitrophica bacterium]|nr:glycerol-3-phosphate 1-O-acyltransferase PlsY [Candidatus Omnitrophota bacterium]